MRILGIALICVLLFALGAFPSAYVEIILDLSSSMSQTIDNETKISIARRALADLLETLPTEVHLAFRVYGHHYFDNDLNSCQDTELLLPFQPLDPQVKVEITQTAQKLTPKGKTPLVFALQQAVQDFAGLSGERAIILITDGEETCGGSLETVANLLSEKGIKVFVVGFDVPSKKKLEPLATKTGGKYHDAQNASELISALTAVAVQIAQPKPLDIEVKDVDAKLSFTIDVPPPKLEAGLSRVTAHTILTESEGLFIVPLQISTPLSTECADIVPMILTAYAPGIAAEKLVPDAKLQNLLALTEPSILVNHAPGILVLSLTTPTIGD